MFMLLILVVLLAANAQAQFIGQTQSPTGYYNPAGADATRNTNGCSDWLSRDPANGGCYLTPRYHTGQDLLVSTPTYTDGTPNGVGHPVYAIADGEIQYISHSGWGGTYCGVVMAVAPGYTGCTPGATVGNIAVVVKHKQQGGGYFLAIYGHLLNYNTVTGRSFENKDGSVIRSTVTKGQPFGLVGYWPYGIHLHFGIYPNFDPAHPQYPAKFGLANDTDADDLDAFGNPLYTDSNGNPLVVNWPNQYGLTDPIQWVTTTVPDNYITNQTTAAINQAAMPSSIVIPLGGVGEVPWNVQSLQGFSGTIQGNVTLNPDLTGKSLKIRNLQDQPKVLGYNQTVPTKSLIHIPNYLPLGTYPAKIQTVSQDSVAGLGTTTSADLIIQVVDSIPGFTENFSTPPTYANNWTYTQAYYPPVVTYTSGLLQLVARIAGQPSQGTFVSKLIFTGDIDVTFTWKHEGYGGTEVGLVAANTTYPPLANIQSNTNGSLVIASGGQNTGTKYSNAPYMNRTLTSRLKRIGNQIQFFMDGNLMETMPFTASGSYSLYFNAFTAPWLGGNNTSSFYSIVVSGPAPGVPTLSAVRTSSNAIAGQNFTVYATASALDPANVQAVIYGGGALCGFGCPVTKVSATPTSYVGTVAAPYPGTYGLQLQNGSYGSSANYYFGVYSPLTATCNPSTSTVAVNTPVTYTGSAYGGAQPHSFTWDNGAVGSGSSITTTYSNGGIVAAVDLHVTDSLGNVANATCGVGVLLGQASVTSLAVANSPRQGTAFNGVLYGMNFDQTPNNLQVQFCPTSGGTCYQHPSAGISISSDIASSQARLTNINLTAGNWVAQARNGSSGTWSNASNSFTVLPPPASFTFTTLNGSQSIQAGNQVGYGLNLTPANNFTNQVTVFVSGLPTNTTIVSPSSLVFSIGPTSGASFTLQLQTTGGTPTGTYTLTLHAQGGGVDQYLYPTLTVTAPPPAPLSISCYLSPNPINLGNGTTIYGNATGGSGGYLYSLNGGAYQSSSNATVLPNDAGTFNYTASVKDSSNATASTSCNVTINGVAPSVTGYTWDSQPVHGVPFSGYVYGNAFTPSSTVWFYGPGCTNGCQHPGAGVAVQSLTTIRLTNVNLGAGSYQVQVRTAYGSANSGNFTVN